jgi:putative ABC transport system substrate-binding protein
MAGLLLLAAVPARAQRKRVYRIGMLENVPIAANNGNLVEFHKGMQELGHAEGASYVVVYRSADGHPERFPALAAELVRQKVDVFVTRGTPAAIAAARLPGRIPVVAAALADPLETGVVASLEQPQGKLTGLASNTNDVGPKRMELLKALAPRMTRIGIVINSANPASAAAWQICEAAAPALRLKPEKVDARRAEDLVGAIEAASAEGIEGLLFGGSALSATNQAVAIEAVALHRLPAMYADRQFVEAGGLASYGAAYPNLYYRAASYVDKVLKGAHPGELAIGRPTKFEFVVNRRTARALELAIPPDLLLRSDDVVE